MTKRKDSTTAAAGIDESAPVQAARTRARRRLIGATLLVGIGIVAFPLVFETRPRPIDVDLPIEIPGKDAVPPLAAPPRAAAAHTAPAPPEPPVAEPAAPAPTPPAAAVAIPATPSPESSSAPAPPRAEAAGAAEAQRRDAQRAQDLLDGKAPVAVAASAAAASKAPRFVVQAGAYTEAAAVRDARQKVERLGLKTYTQVIQADGAARTRVRVGPFASRDEAEQAAARIRSAGLQANILVL